MKRWLYQFFVETIRKTNEEQRDYLADQRPDKIAWEPLAVCITVAICLTLQEYCFSMSVLLFIQDMFREWIPAQVHAALNAPENQEIIRLGFNNFGDLLIYIAIPLLVTRFICRRSLADYGLGLRDAAKGWWVYLVMYLIMIGPIIVIKYITR